MIYIIMALATWRISNLIVNEDGPWELLERLRNFIGVKDGPYGKYGTNVIARGISCVWCLSVWIGAILTAIYLILPDVTLPLTLPFALSTVAVILDEVINGEGDDSDTS